MVIQGLYSDVARHEFGGVGIYIKTYHAGPDREHNEVLVSRCAREAEVITRLAQLESLRGRLGRLELVHATPSQLQLSTREVAGETLQHFLRQGFSGPATKVRAVFLAGKWLQEFQRLPYIDGEGLPLGDVNPPDLSDYCDIRLQSLHDYDPLWLNAARRTRFLSVIGRLVKASPQADRNRVWSHRDYHPGNLLWDGRTMTGIDFTMSAIDFPLSDVTYFIHRIEMQRLYRPWLQWPIAAWRRAFLRGYGRPDAESSPMYSALMIRHLLCRLLTYAKREPRDRAQAIHNAYVRFRLKRRLLRMFARCDC